MITYLLSLLLCSVHAFHLKTSRTATHTPTITSTSTTLSSLSLNMAGGTPFVKFNGLGNDFILIDNTKQDTPLFTPEQATKICNRNFGVGGDGVIFVMPGTEGCDYTMRIYNSDGSEPEMCGNGIRCMARMILEIEGKDKGAEGTYTIATGAGKIIPQICKDGTITVDMGEPILSPPEKIPTTLPSTTLPFHTS